MRLQAQALNGAAHGQERSLQDIESVYLFHAGLGHRAAQGFGADLVIELFAPFGAELFGVVEALDRVLVVQNHGGSNHRPGQRTTAGLVHTGDQAMNVPGKGHLLDRA